jgi:hypothetical protein
MGPWSGARMLTLQGKPVKAQQPALARVYSFARVRR